MQEFKIRPYSKSQLAKIYFPELSTIAARHRLARWIARCKPLCEQLAESNYNKRSHWYTPNQVRCIISHLGEP